LGYSIISLAAGDPVVMLSQNSQFHKYNAKRIHQNKEDRLPDKTRIDCLTTTHAVEHDFGSKWAEAIG